MWHYDANQENDSLDFIPSSTNDSGLTELHGQQATEIICITSLTDV